MTDRSTPPPVNELLTGAMPPETVEVLPNGLTFHRFSGGDQPVCRLRILFCGGQAETGNKLISKVMLSALAEGTQTIPTETFADLLDYNGVRIGSDSHSHYSSLTIAMLNHRAASVTPLIASMLAEPLFPQERIDTMLRNVKAQLEIADTEVSTLAEYASDALTMGKNHPLAQRLTPSDIDAITRDDIISLHRRMIVPARAHAYLSGLLDETTIDAVRTLLGGIKATGPGFDIKIVPNEPEPPGRVDVYGADTLQSAIAATLPAVSRSHPDYNDLRLTVMALGGYFGSRLMSNIREEKGMTYGISAYLSGAHEGSYITIAATCDKQYTDDVLREISLEMTRLADEPPCADELSRLKRHALTSLAQTLDSPTSISGYYITSLLVGPPPDYFAAQQQAIKALTAERISYLANEYLDPTKLRIAVAS